MKIELTREDICYLHDCIDADIECRERDLKAGIVLSYQILN